MASQDKRFIDAANCADRAGRYAFGLNDAKAVAALRQLADDLEAGVVTLHSVTTSSHATHNDFSVREFTVEVLEEVSQAGPKIVRD